MEAIFLCFKGTHLSLESFTRFFSKNRRFQRRLWPQPAGCERTLASASSGGGGETVRSFPPGWLNIHLTGRNRQMEIHAVWLFKTAKHRDAASASGRCGPAELQWNADELFHIEVHAVWPFKTAKHRDAASVSGHCGPAELQWNADELFHLRFTPFGRSKRPNTGTLRVSRAAAGWLNIHLTGRNRQMEVHAVWPFKTAKHCFDSGGKRNGRTFAEAAGLLPGD